jgi:preprotein translocase subunit SecY
LSGIEFAGDQKNMAAKRTSAPTGPGKGGGSRSTGQASGSTFWESLQAAWTIPDLRRRIQFNFAMFAVYVVGLHIPIPGINHAALSSFFGKTGGGNGLLQMMDLFSGGALRMFTVFAMGIIPYINASIIMQLFTFAFPHLQELSREGESGRRVIAQYTRYMTIALALMQAGGTTVLLTSNGVLPLTLSAILPTVFSLVAGTCFLMWLGELITERGIGNGVSLIIFSSIMTRLPQQIGLVWTAAQAGSVSPLQVLLLLVAFFGTVLGIVYMTLGQRRVPIQHVRRVVGNKMSQGGTSYLPFRVNSAGVIPIIFAVSIQLLPLTLAQYVPATTKIGLIVHKVADAFQVGKSPWTAMGYAIIIIFFTYFWTAVMMDIPHIAQDLRKYGSYIPGIRMGKPTEEYLDRVMSRITLAGAVFLAIVALLQYYVPEWTNTQGSFTLVGGTSLLIVVGVALDTMQAIEAQLLMRHYEGFIR